MTLELELFPSPAADRPALQQRHDSATPAPELRELEAALTRDRDAERAAQLHDIYLRRVYAPARLEPQLELPRPPVIDLPRVMRERAAAGRFDGGNASSPFFGEGAALRAAAAVAAVIAKSANSSELEGSAPAVGRSALVQTRVEFPPPDKSLDVRELRALVQNRVRHLHPINSNLRKCCRRRFRGHVEAKVKNDGSGDRGFVTGVIRCASVWSCPRCAPRVSSVRAGQVKTVVVSHRATGGEVYMLTLTVPHELQMRCKRLRRHVSRAWQLVQMGAPWRRLKKRMQFAGSITAREITHGGAGWHPHLHILIASARPLEDEERYQLEVDLFIRWATMLERVPGMRLACPSWERGISFIRCSREDYIEKLGLADELTRAMDKKGRTGNRTPFEIMADYARSKRGADAQLYREYSRGMKGARQLTWSRGKDGANDLRQRYAAELRAAAGELDQGEIPGFESDAQLLEREERAGVVVRQLAGRQWDALVRVMRRANLDPDFELSTAAESSGAIGVDALLARAYYVGRELARNDRSLRKWLPWLEPIPI